MRRFSAGEMEYISAGNIAWPHKTKGKIADSDSHYESCISIQTALCRGTVHVCNRKKNQGCHIDLQYGAKNDLSVIRSGMLKRLLNLLVYTQRVFSLEQRAEMAHSQRWSAQLGHGLGRWWDYRTAYFRQALLVQKSLSLFNHARHKSAYSLALKPDNSGFESLWTTMFSSKP